jgi:hypothetical protein
VRRLALGLVTLALSLWTQCAQAQYVECPAAQVVAGPVSGPAAQTGCRALLQSDLPPLNYSGDALTAPITFTGSFTGSAIAPFTQFVNISLTDTGTSVSGISKINAETVKLSFGGAGTGPGNRNALWATLTLTGPTGYNTCCLFNSAGFSWTDIKVGNTTPTALDYNGDTALMEMEGSSIANVVNGLETDVDLGGTSSAVVRVGHLIDIGGGTVPPTIRGSAYDAAISLSMDNGTSSSAAWKNGLVLGNVNGAWPFASDSKIITTYGGAGPADTGIDLSAITFTTAAIKTPNFQVSANGRISATPGVDGQPLGFFAGLTKGLRIQTDSTAAYVAATDPSGISSFQNLVLQASAISFSPQTPGQPVTSSAPLKMQVYTFAALTALYTCNSGNEGIFAMITDSVGTTFHTTVTGGGANHVTVYCNGTGWFVGG